MNLDRLADTDWPLGTPITPTHPKSPRAGKHGIVSAMATACVIPDGRASERT